MKTSFMVFIVVAPILGILAWVVISQLKSVYKSWKFWKSFEKTCNQIVPCYCTNVDCLGLKLNKYIQNEDNRGYNQRYVHSYRFHFVYQYNGLQYITYRDEDDSDIFKSSFLKKINKGSVINIGINSCNPSVNFIRELDMDTGRWLVITVAMSSILVFIGYIIYAIFKFI